MLCYTPGRGRVLTLYNYTATGSRQKRPIASAHLHGQSDVVQAVQQAVLAEGVHLEGDGLRCVYRLKKEKGKGKVKER